MKEKSESGGGGYVRADQIDLKSLDEQLQRHLSRAWTMEKNKNNREDKGEEGGGQLRPSNTGRRQEWEIDPSQLIIKSVIARGTFGTVHRGMYDGQDVAVKLLDWGEEGHRSEAEIASLRAAFTQEVAVWHKLNHPNVTKNLRPEIPRCCPSSLANVMKRCWDANPDKRPEMDEVVSMLEAIDTSKGGGMIPHDQTQGCLCFRRYRGP
ncbi:hypothetical protein GOBAR_DD08763 [Gossypium barbadense]|nr:hypothetical protein GOBAR_DD08763 [Gossypium barbadense]